MQRCKDAKKQRKTFLKTMHLCTYASMQLFTVYYLLFNLIFSPVMALDLDTSVDDEIRKNYNPSKLEEDVNNLPPLPKTLNDTSIKADTYSLIRQQAQVQPQKYNQLMTNKVDSNYIVIKKGTKIKLKLLNSISDQSRKGSRVLFTSTYPIVTTYFTIPVGTTFKGEIIKSHKPQFIANGGLITIDVNSMIINNEVQPIKAHVTKADSKFVFCNNIKGKRKYFKSMVKSTKNGRHFFAKMIRVTGVLATDGSSIIIAPFAIGAGAMTAAANICVSPVLALFHKGESITIKAGSNFEIKLNQNVYIYN